MVWASVNSLKLCQLDLLSVFTCHHWQSWLVSSAVQILQSTGSVFVLDFFGSGQWESCDTVKQTSNTHPIFHLQPGCKHLSAWGVPRCCFVGGGEGRGEGKAAPLAPWPIPRAVCTAHQTTLQLFPSAAHLDPVLTLPPPSQFCGPCSGEENYFWSYFLKQSETMHACVADLELCLSRCISKPVVFHTTLCCRQGLLNGVK